jgi:hypothetical protein
MARSHVAVAGTMALLLGSALVLFAADPPKAKEQGKATTPVADPKKVEPATPKKEVATPPAKAKIVEIKPVEIKTGEAAIEKALAELTDFDFKETPLNQVIEQLKNRHHIEIQIDKEALDDAGVETDTPVSCRVKGVPLGSGLHLMLKQLHLTWVFQYDVLLITSTDEEYGRLGLITRVYDVADLVVFRDKDEDLWDNYDPLIGVITGTVDTITWEAAGGDCAITGDSLGTAKVLTISQTLENHRAIADLLAKIREITKKNPDGELPRMDKPKMEEKRKFLPDPFRSEGHLELPTPKSPEDQGVKKPSEKPVR